MLYKGDLIMSKKIAILSASWHTNIVNSAENSAIEELVKLGYARENIDVIKVPGAVEIPLAGKLALENGYDCAIGIALVVDGQIYRHEFVGHTVVQGILDASLATNKPFISAVLTPQRYNENSDLYEEMYIKHFVVKGQEAAKAADQAIQVVEQLSAGSQANKAAA
tara:strand:+ start:1056 stop:1553 length:498 start_codon:yes stop_codon:yes gene_type:complete